MAKATLEERVSAVEADIAELKGAMRTGNAPQGCNWLDLWFGAFKDDADFEEAMRRGEEYRKSSPREPEPAGDDVSA